MSATLTPTPVLTPARTLTGDPSPERPTLTRARRTPDGRISSPGTLPLPGEPTDRYHGLSEILSEIGAERATDWEPIERIRRSGVTLKRPTPRTRSVAWVDPVGPHGEHGPFPRTARIPAHLDGVRVAGRWNPDQVTPDPGFTRLSPFTGQPRGPRTGAARSDQGKVTLRRLSVVGRYRLLTTGRTELPGVIARTRGDRTTDTPGAYWCRTLLASGGEPVKRPRTAKRARSERAARSVDPASVDAARAMLDTGVIG